MGLADFLILLLIAGICGAVAEALVGFSPGGFLVSVGVGLVGALVGNWLAVTFGWPGLLPIGGIDVVWTIIGSVVLLAVLKVIRRRR